MKLFKLLLLALLVGILAAPFASANRTCISFFYGNGCSHCAKVEPLIGQLELKYPDLDVRRFEIYSNRQNAVLLDSFFGVYNVSYAEQGIPIVFVSGSYLSGDAPIISSLESYIKRFDGAGCPVAAGSSGGGLFDGRKLYLLLVVAAVVVIFLLLNKWVRRGRWRV